MTCDDCRYFARLANECRRKSPQAVLAQSPVGGLTILGIFPTTKPANWCGEWAREQEQES